ncbi:hypothetical protein GJ496_006717 [Pomphorhynchus laevis]|nr:hypothetical protein GJ496_006717 [Pomphorhynchus laevis]
MANSPKSQINFALLIAGQFCVVYLDDGRVSYTRKVAGLPFADELIDELNESITKRWSSYNLSRKYSLAFQHDQYTAAKRRILVNTLTQELILNSLAQNLINFENFIDKSKVNENFDRYGFLRQCPKSRYKFVSQLTLSQIFANFIDSYSDQNNLKTDFSIFQSRLKSLSKLPREDNNYISASYVLDTEHDTITNLTNPVKHTPYFDFNCEYNDPYENEKSAFMFLVECPEFKESTGVITEVNDPFLTGRRLSVDSRMLSTDVACSRILQECKNRCQQLVSKLSIERTTEEQQESSIVDNICNLIEMIWAHGFKIEKVKSPLWYHLTHYNLIEFYATNNFPVDDIDVKYGIRWCIQRRRKRYQESSSSSVNLSEIESNIDKLNCFSTESEKSQVLVSYCMEYGIITLLFTQLLSNSDLLTALYRKDSIIRDSDGREKILMYTQILTIRKFRCFSSKISDTKIPYNLNIFGKRSKKSSKVTICLYGTTGTTGEITITEDRNSLTFLCRSIGDLIFMSLRYLKIGSLVDIEKITINQQLTRQHCIFNCKRFITHKGKIGATSSFIVPAYVISSDSVNNEDVLNPNAKTKIIPERLNSLTNSYVEDTELRDRLWYAVTECCQLLSSEEARSGSYFYFFFQINGICHHFESILSDGLKSPLFQKKYLWDAITAYLQVNHVISRSQDLVTTKTRSSSTRLSRKSFSSTNSLNITNCIHIINDYFDQFDCSMRFKLWMLLSWRMLYLKKSLIILGHFLRTSKQYQADAFIRQIDGLSFICQEAGRLEQVHITSICSITTRNCPFSGEQLKRESGKMVDNEIAKWSFTYVKSTLIAKIAKDRVVEITEDKYKVMVQVVLGQGNISDMVLAVKTHFSEICDHKIDAFYQTKQFKCVALAFLIKIQK